MSCCGTPPRGDGRGPAAATPPPWLAAIADGSAPPRARFAGGGSHVGTARPVIAQDGEGPVRAVTLTPFQAELVPVTNARFAAFVLATGYASEAEAFGWAPVFRPFLADPRSAPPAGPALPWWGRGDGACWHAPEGAGTDVLARAQHPAVHLSWADARAFAAWAGGRLPTEAEWEHAARGGLADPRFPWGDREPDDTGFLPCNIWQGRFPYENTAADGWRGTSPVGTFPPNAAGLCDMAGNVWEWTADPFRAQAHAPCETALDEKVTKGGSFLCHRSYCYRYRIAARSALAADTGACNVGLRVFYDG